MSITSPPQRYWTLDQSTADLHAFYVGPGEPKHNLSPGCPCRPAKRKLARTNDEPREIYMHAARETIDELPGLIKEGSNQ